MKSIYKTQLGQYYCGRVEDLEKNVKLKQYKGKVNLILTSPPFPLARPKRYGNLEGEQYVNWIGGLANILKEYLTEDGSIVIEIGNSWEKGTPVMSVLPIKALLSFLENGDLKLCQQFIWHNTAKLPSPAQWVNVKRIRVKDSFTNIWWMSKSEYAKADNKKILIEYSKSMKQLLTTQKYNSGQRPSEHSIGEKSFLTNNNGAIPSSVISISNTQSEPSYINYCRRNNYKPHPARMAKGLAEFFINFLTDEGDLIMDPFGGSNITGFTAEKFNRRWISIEKDIEYIKGSFGRFTKIK